MSPFSLPDTEFAGSFSLWGSHGPATLEVTSICMSGLSQLLCPFEWGSSLAMNAANWTNTALFTLCGKSAAICSHRLFLVFPLIATKQFVYEMCHILTQTRYCLYFHLYSQFFCSDISGAEITKYILTSWLTEEINNFNNWLIVIYPAKTSNVPAIQCEDLLLPLFYTTVDWKGLI